METTLLQYTATALVEEYLFPLAKQQKRRTRAFLALVIFIILASWYLLRKLCRGWGRRIPARVLSHWEHLTVTTHERRSSTEEEQRHDQAVRTAWSCWAILWSRIARNEVATTWSEWSAIGNRIRHHAWHLDDRHRRARQNRRS